jgi:hypothetical protein
MSWCNGPSGYGSGVTGTVLAHGRILVSRDTDDFRWISEIKRLNPLADRA